MSAKPVIAAPHAHDGGSVTRTMGLVMLALVPTTMFGFIQFGWPAVFLFLVTIISAIAAEALCLVVARKPVMVFLHDNSALLAGWIVALTLPPWAPWWVGCLGAILAIVVGKQIFGGLGQNIFNPAMVARVMLLVSFPLEMTRFIDPNPIFSSTAPGFMEGLSITFAGAADFDAISSASILGHVRMMLGQGLALPDILAGVYDPLALFVGYVSGSMGETSALSILLGGLFLIYKRIISWHTPAAMIGTLTVLASISHFIDPEHYPDAIFHIVSGTFMLGAFFIATDYVTAPLTNIGRFIFGAGCGALVYIIRTWAAFPEGVGFSILLMNAMTPVIDYYIKPRIFGRTRSGGPLNKSGDGKDA